jgi:hypothetical protein
VRGASNGAALGPTPPPPPPPPSAPTPNEDVGATLTIAGPNRVASGQEFAVTVTAQSDSPIRNGEVNLSWDASLFDAVGNEGAGGLTLPLTPAGNTATAQLRLRARTELYGDGIIAVTGSRISAAADDISANNPPALAIKVGKP